MLYCKTIVAIATSGGELFLHRGGSIVHHVATPVAIYGYIQMQLCMLVKLNIGAFKPTVAGLINVPL